MLYQRKTYRIYRCGLCGWISAEFGARNRIIMELMALAHVQLCEHFHDKHDQASTMSNISVEILDREDYMYLRLLQGDDVGS